jgi:hypothetical protein
VAPLLVFVLIMGSLAGWQYYERQANFFSAAVVANANARDLRDSSTAAYELEASLALWKEHQESSWYVRIMESMFDWKGIRSEELFARQTIERAIQNVIGNNVVVEFREQSKA